MSFGTNAGQQKNMGRANRACTENGLRPLYSEHLATTLDFNPGCPVAIKHNALHHYVRPDRQVEPVAGWSQVGQCRANTHAVLDISWERSHACGFRVVLVGVVGKPFFQTRTIKRLSCGEPFISFVTTYRNGTIRAMKVVPEVHVSFELSKIG